MLRTAFRQRVRPYRDRPDLECWIDWYPCAEGADVLGFPTAFNTNLYQGDWWEREGVGPVGYVGRNNWAEEKPGRGREAPCLTPQEAADGFVYDADLVCERGPDGLPLCCGLGLVAVGGMVLGGRADFDIPAACTPVFNNPSCFIVEVLDFDVCYLSSYSASVPFCWWYGTVGTDTPAGALEVLEYHEPSLIRVQRWDAGGLVETLGTVTHVGQVISWPLVPGTYIRVVAFALIPILFEWQWIVRNP